MDGPKRSQGNRVLELLCRRQGTHPRDRKPWPHPRGAMPRPGEVSRASSLRSSSETTLDTPSKCGGVG
jgi:hypothetical protein